MTGSSGDSGLRLSLPVDVRLSASRSSTPARHAAPVVRARVKAGVTASLAAVSVRARVNLSLCAGSARQCGERLPGAPTPIPPAPPTPPPTPPAGTRPPSAPPAGTGATGHSASALTIAGDSLPFTGGPIGALTLLGMAAVATGAGGIAASRLRANRG